MDAGQGKQVVWLGPAGSDAASRARFSDQGFEIVAFEDVDDAVAKYSGQSLAVAIVFADWDGARNAVEQITLHWPDIDVLAATKDMIPVSVTTAIRAGASRFLDLNAVDDESFVAPVCDAIERQKRLDEEDELLLRLRRLNDGFMHNVEHLQKRALELEESAESPAGEGPYRILVIDDEPAVRLVFEEVLSSRGYETVTAEDGERGLAEFREQPFPLAIIDKNLPGIDGLAVLGEIKALAPDTEVMLITAHSSKDSAISALDLGATAYLEKPFDDIARVEARIEEVVSKQRRRRRNRRHRRSFEERNREFLEHYRQIRSELEVWLEARSKRPGSRIRP